MAWDNHGMIWVGQFGVAAGDAREDTPWIGVYQDDDAEEDRSDLYVLVEPALPGSEEFCAEMKDATRVYRLQDRHYGGYCAPAQRSRDLRDWTAL